MIRMWILFEGPILTSIPYGWVQEGSVLMFLEQGIPFCISGDIISKILYSVHNPVRMANDYNAYSARKTNVIVNTSGDIMSKVLYSFVRVNC